VRRPDVDRLGGDTLHPVAQVLSSQELVEPAFQLELLRRRLLGEAEYGGIQRPGSENCCAAVSWVKPSMGGFSGPGANATLESAKAKTMIRCLRRIFMTDLYVRM
jgi:hypothetical protein